MLLEDSKMWGGITNHASALVWVSCSQSCLLLLLQFRNSDFVAGMGNEWVGAAEWMPNITQPGIESSEERERAGGGGGSHHGDDNPGQVRMAFSSPQTIWRHTQTELCAVPPHRMPGWVHTNLWTRGLNDQQDIRGAQLTNQREVNNTLKQGWQYQK